MKVGPVPGRLLALLLVTAALAAGCETAGSDFADLTESFVPPSPSQAARMAANLNDPDERRKGIVLLSNAPFGGAEPYVVMYREYAGGDPDPIARAASVRALGRHGGIDDAALLAANLENKSVQVRWEAAKGLQRIHNRDVVTAMLATLRDDEEDDGVRTEIARGLGQYPQDRVFHALVASLDLTPLAINAGARSSLEILTGEEFGLEPADWLSWFKDTRARGDDPFAGRKDYVFPTYQRNVSILEKLAFWSTPTFEQPAPPMGLRPTDQKSTYGDEDGE